MSQHYNRNQDVVPNDPRRYQGHNSTNYNHSQAIANHNSMFNSFAMQDPFQHMDDMFSSFGQMGSMFGGMGGGFGGSMFGSMMGNSMGARGGSQSQQQEQQQLGMMNPFGMMESMMSQMMGSMSSSMMGGGGMMPSGQFSSQTMVTSTVIGPDGKPQTKRFAQSTVGDAGRNIVESQQAFEDTATGVQRLALERQHGEDGHKVVKERNVISGDSGQRDYFRGSVNEHTAASFNQTFSQHRQTLPQAPSGGFRSLNGSIGGAQTSHGSGQYPQYIEDRRNVQPLQRTSTNRGVEDGMGYERSHMRQGVVVEDVTEEEERNHQPNPREVHAAHSGSSARVNGQSTANILREHLK